jgi:aryl-alcohol dehydrogenase-like predicted oxidoreductase
MNDKGAIDGSPEFVRASINKALKRLDIPFVDLFYVHRLDKKTPIETTVGELKKLKAEGLIKHIGLSECSSESLRRACKVEHIDAVQIEYSPFSLEIESEQIALLKTCRELGVAVVAYSPIGRGMLGGKMRSPKDFGDGDFRKFSPRFSEEVSRRMIPPC